METKIIYGLMPAIPTEEYLIIKDIKQKKVGFTTPTYMTEIKLLDSRTNLHYYLSIVDVAHHPEFYLSDQVLLERLTPKDKEEQDLRLLGMFRLGISDLDEIDDPKYEKIHNLLHLLSFLNDKTDEERKELSPLFFNQKGSEIQIPSDDDPIPDPSDLDQITKKHPELDPEYDFSQWDIIDLKNQAMEDQQSQRVVELVLKKDKKTVYIAGIKEQKKIHIDVSNQSYFGFIRQHHQTENPHQSRGLITAPMREEPPTKVEPSESVKQLFDLILKILDWDTNEIAKLQEEIHQDILEEKTAD